MVGEIEMLKEKGTGMMRLEINGGESEKVYLNQLVTQEMLDSLKVMSSKSCWWWLGTGVERKDFAIEFKGSEECNLFRAALDNAMKKSSMFRKIYSFFYA